MAPSHWRLILNGKSTDNEDLREAVGVLRKRGIQLDVRVTWEEGDAERYVAEAIADGVQTVVAAGGDGEAVERRRDSAQQFEVPQVGRQQPLLSAYQTV